MSKDVTRSAKSAALTIDPLVMLCILDHYTRRERGQGGEDTGVIGTLLGSSVDGVLEVRSCFPVPHTESNTAERGSQLMFDLEYFRGMYDLHQRVNSKDVIVGWYATGLSAQATQIHEHYARKMNTPPLHLLVDPQLTNGSLNVKALVSTRFTLGKVGRVGPLFKELPFDWKCHNPAEKVALDTMVLLRHGRKPALRQVFEGLPSQLPTDDLQSCLRSSLLPGQSREARDTRPAFEKVHRDLLQVKAVLDKCVKYCDTVLDGHEEEDHKIGRALLNVVQTLPPAPASFDKLFNATMQDMLMLTYLAKLTKTQVALMERLHVYIPDPKTGRDQQQQQTAAAPAPQEG